MGDMAVTSVVEYDASERAGGGDAGIALYQTCVEAEEDAIPLYNSTSVGQSAAGGAG